MSTATIEKAEWKTLVSKKVTIVRNLPEPNEKGESSVEIEGTVQAINDEAVLIKPKGKVNFEMIPAGEIEEIYPTPEGDKKFTRSKLKEVAEGAMRRHLLDRHGITLTWANAATEEQAVEYHSGLNHEELDLGHVHVAEKAEEAAAPTETPTA